jgi:tetratricopeptide (TPR) repeat protein
MKRVSAALLALAVAGCTTTLESGERLYDEGDLLGALEVWSAAPESDPAFKEINARINELKDESDQLVVRYKKQASYYESRSRLAQSILNYRLALKLQKEDPATLRHVQKLARDLATRKTALKKTLGASMDAKNLAAARRDLDRLRTLDPFDPELETAKRQLDVALEAEIKRRLKTGERGLSTANYRAAKHAFKAVLALDPDNESARGYLRYIDIRREIGATGEGTTAPPVFEPFATEAEIRAEGFYQNGLDSEDAQEVYKAIRYYEQALEADSGHALADRRLKALRSQNAKEVPRWIDMGRDAFVKEELQRALEYWDKALLLDPRNDRAKAYKERANRQIENLERLRAEPDVAGAKE